MEVIPAIMSQSPNTLRGKGNKGLISMQLIEEEALGRAVR